MFSTVFPVLQRYISGFEISEHVDLILCEGYIGYFLLGYYLKKYHSEVSWRKGLILAMLGILATGVACIIEWQSTKGGNYQGYFYQEYLTPFVVLAAAGVFLCFQNISWTEKEKPRKMLQLGSMLSIGVFYVHMLVLTVLEYIGLTGATNVMLLLVKVLLTYVLSLVAAFIISKIPYVRKILMGLK